MKSLKNYPYLLAMAALCATPLLHSCADMLDLYLESSISDQNFWKSEQDLELFANGFYGILPGAQGPGADDQSDCYVNEKPNTWLFNLETIPTSGGGWSSGDWGNIRSANYFMNRYSTVTGDAAGVAYLKEKLEGFLDPEYAEGLITIIRSVEAVKTADFRIVFDPTLVRGMSYYTGPIFEIAMDEYGGSVGGGGRYDEMIGKFTGQNTPACGFSIGFERIIMLLLERDFQIPGTARKKAYLLDKKLPQEAVEKLIARAMEERKMGLQVNLAVMKKNKKFQKEQLEAEGYAEIEEIYADRG